MNKFSISSIIGKNSAILHSDGLMLFEKIKDVNEPFIVSFEGIEHCTTAFLNASIGKLLAEDPKKSAILGFEGLSGNDYLESKVKLVLENAGTEKKRISLDNSARGFLFA
jgi:hypothetical protein